jgi:hypothetical protein
MVTLSIIGILLIAVGGVLTAIGVLTLAIHSSYSRTAQQRLQRRAMHDTDNNKIPPSANHRNVLRPAFPFLYDIEKDQCAVCLESNCDIITACEHYFHFQCLVGWLTTRSICPVCRNRDIYQLTIIQCPLCKMTGQNLSTFSQFALNLLKK